MLKGRVIRIVDSHRVIFNLGSDDGVVRGQNFAIYTPEETIVDPFSKEVLGAYRERKAIVVARIVAERFTIATARRRSWTEGLMLGLGGVGVAREEPAREADPYALPVDHTQIKPLPTGSTIRVGDIVEQMPAVEKPATADTATEESPQDGE